MSASAQHYTPYGISCARASPDRREKEGREVEPQSVRINKRAVGMLSSTAVTASYGGGRDRVVRGSAAGGRPAASAASSAPGTGAATSSDVRPLTQYRPSFPSRADQAIPPPGTTWARQPAPATMHTRQHCAARAAQRLRRLPRGEGENVVAGVFGSQGEAGDREAQREDRELGDHVAQARLPLMVASVRRDSRIASGTASRSPRDDCQPGWRHNRTSTSEVT
jgi:hypothetical protein